MIKRSTGAVFIKTKKYLTYMTDIDKLIITKKEQYGNKSSFLCFFGYNDDDVIRSLCIKLLQMIGYVKHFDSNKTMSFKVNDNRLLKKYTKIWEQKLAF